MKKRKKILIVEDEKEQGECLKELLCLKLGKGAPEVIHVTSGAEALEHISQDTEVVVLDIILPDMSGLEVLKHIKERAPSVPVIIITAYGTEDMCLRAFRLGARDYIKKPFSFTELVEKIKAIHEKRYSRIGMDTEIFETLKIPPQVLPKLLKAKTYIDNNYMLPITISDICSVSGLNRVYLCKYFKTLTGHTCNGYIRRLRMAHALQLIKEGEQSISDVSVRLGYSPKYFSTLFKKTYGITPRKLKK